MVPTNTKHFLLKSLQWNSCNKWIQRDNGLVVSTSRVYSKQIFCNQVPSSLLAHTTNSVSKLVMKKTIFETFSNALRLVLHYSVTFQIGPSFQTQDDLNAFTSFCCQSFLFLKCSFSSLGLFLFLFPFHILSNFRLLHTSPPNTVQARWKYSLISFNTKKLVARYNFFFFFFRSFLTFSEVNLHSIELVEI